MKKLSRVFVSYTIRDGYVTPELLKKFESNLQEICTPFIHATIPNYSDIGQGYVLKKLFFSHIVFLIDSPAVYKSPWVKLELIVAKLMLMPIVIISVEQIKSFLDDGYSGLQKVRASEKK